MRPPACAAAARARRTADSGWRGALLDAVDAGLAKEIRQALRRAAGATHARSLIAAVAADHVPRRVADDGVEPPLG